MASPRLPYIQADVSALVRSLTFGVVWLAVMVVLLDLWLHLTGTVASDDLARLFDSTSETGLGSWIAITQTGLIAVTLWGFAALARGSGVSRTHVAAWVALAVFFSYLALDDGTRLHERVGSAFAESDASERGIGGAFPSYYWQLLFGPALLGMGGFTFWFLWRQNPEAKGRLGLAFTLLGVAVAMDFVDGLYASHALNMNVRLGMVEWVDAQSERSFSMTGIDTVRHLSRSIEESLEIIAMGVLWGAILLCGARLAPGIQIDWTRPAPDAHTVPSPEAHDSASA